MGALSSHIMEAWGGTGCSPENGAQSPVLITESHMTVTHKTTKAKGDLIFLKETAEGNSFVHYNRHELLNASHSDGKGIHPVGIHPTAFHQASPALGTAGGPAPT